MHTFHWLNFLPFSNYNIIWTGEELFAIFLTFSNSHQMEQIAKNSARIFLKPYFSMVLITFLTSFSTCEWIIWKINPIWDVMNEKKIKMFVIAILYSVNKISKPFYEGNLKLYVTDKILLSSCNIKIWRKKNRTLLHFLKFYCYRLWTWLDWPLISKQRLILIQFTLIIHHFLNVFSFLLFVVSKCLEIWRKVGLFELLFFLDISMMWKIFQLLFISLFIHFASYHDTLYLASAFFSYVNLGHWLSSCSSTTEKYFRGITVFP